MAKKAFEAIMAGIEDAVAYAKGDKGRGTAHRVRAPEAVRRALR